LKHFGEQIPGEPDIDICLRSASKSQVAEALEKAKSHSNVMSARLIEREPEHFHLFLNVKSGSNIDQVRLEVSPKQDSKD
jgi:hypothetical protein